MAQFRGDASPKTWLTKIAVNVCRNMRRTAWFRRFDHSVTPEDLPLSAPAEGDTITIPFEYFSCECSLTERSNFQRVPDSIILKASTKPLWEISSNESFDAPGFGVRVDSVSIIGTVVQSYWTINYTVTDVETAYNLGWNFNLLDMNKEYLPGGVLGTGGAPMPEYNGQQQTYIGAFKAMEQPPEQLMILLRNWDDLSLNNYFPITLT